MNRSILVVDIGNSSTSAGLYRLGRIVRHRRLETPSSSAVRVKALIDSVLASEPAERAVVASVVPPINGLWRKALGRCRCTWVNHRLNLGVRVTYDRPATIGADRLANACAGVQRYGAPLIIADFGTAVTFDVVTRRDGYVGGVIAPGLPLMFSYLAEKTAKLPLLKPGPARGTMGKSTAQAMQLGARWGYRGMVREILSELMKDPALRRARLIATGGYADWVVRGLMPPMIVDQELTLYGLGKIAELNP